MENQISNIVKICNHHLRNIAFIRKYLNKDTLKTLIHNHVISRLDYCNSISYRLPNILLKKKNQNIQNTAARLIKKIPLRERITPALIERGRSNSDHSEIPTRTIMSTNSNRSEFLKYQPGPSYQPTRANTQTGSLEDSARTWPSICVQKWQ